MKVLASLLASEFKGFVDGNQKMDPKQFQDLLGDKSQEKQAFSSESSLNNGQLQMADQASHWLTPTQSWIDHSHLLASGKQAGDIDLSVNTLGDGIGEISSYHLLLANEKNDTAVSGLGGAINLNVYAVSGLSSNTNSSESRDSKLLQQRLLPLGSLGNGYLSIISHSDLLSKQSGTRLYLNSVEQMKNQEFVAKTETVLNKEQNSLPTLISEVVNNAFAVNASQKQFSNSTERVWAHIELNPIHSEIVKRFFMQTPGNEGNTFWYRDYEMSELDKQTLATRLVNSEFANENKIQRLVINGSLIWNVFDRNSDNDQGRFS
ncbi:hypothetical protein KIH87_12795 [Paraneptunicella aestuarii]|uniref:hypothetical protein n=1 Tax=Paraneptunicella aestuarii TaxID=2831148 RepID=UPI001E43B547|nr:hypothetical protein [Paraneptunicella aestuarii]UAA37587.1 hypothetical protein KIH87_12795 [Paraneptunicella aestuarii]